jgi:hypothetical protein
MGMELQIIDQPINVFFFSHGLPLSQKKNPEVVFTV